MRALLALTLVVLLVAPASAGATLVYETNQIGRTSRIVVANDDGSAPRALSTAGLSRLALPLHDPRISPDGTQVAALDSNYQRGSVVVLPVAGGAPRVVFTARQPNGAWWSPDGARLAVTTQRGLYVLDALTGSATKLAAGAVQHGSFSPIGDRIADDVNRGRRSNMPVVPTAGGAPTPLTADGRSRTPVIRPRAIAYAKQTPIGPGRTAQIWLVAPDRSGNRQLTNARLRGYETLSPAAWSKQLVASLGRTGISFAWSVDVTNGATGQIGDY